MKAVPVVEQDTQFYQRPTAQPVHDDEQDTPIRPQKPVTPQSPFSPPPAPKQPTADPDWTIIGLGMAALIMLIGLIPLWYFVFRAWTG